MRVRAFHINFFKLKYRLKTYCVIECVCGCLQVSYNVTLKGGASECVSGFGAGGLEFIDATTAFQRWLVVAEEWILWKSLHKNSFTVLLYSLLSSFTHAVILPLFRWVCSESKFGSRPQLPRIVWCSATTLSPSAPMHFPGPLRTPKWPLMVRPPKAELMSNPHNTTRVWEATRWVHISVGYFFFINGMLIPPFSTWADLRLQQCCHQHVWELQWHCGFSRNYNRRR